MCLYINSHTPSNNLHTAWHNNNDSYSVFTFFPILIIRILLADASHYITMQKIAELHCYSIAPRFWLYVYDLSRERNDIMKVTLLFAWRSNYSQFRRRTGAPLLLTSCRSLWEHSLSRLVVVKGHCSFCLAAFIRARVSERATSNELERPSPQLYSQI